MNKLFSGGTDKLNDGFGFFPNVTILLFKRDVSWRNDSCDYEDNLELNKGVLLLSGYWGFLWMTSKNLKRMFKKYLNLQLSFLHQIPKMPTTEWFIPCLNISSLVVFGSHREIQGQHSFDQYTICILSRFFSSPSSSTPSRFVSFQFIIMSVPFLLLDPGWATVPCQI
jgi:hypothetical protein